MTARRNQHGGRCVRCGKHVAALQGLLEWDASENGWVVHHEDCAIASEPRPTETPRWAVPAYGRTPAGNLAHGMTLVDGERPQGECYPVNAAAQAIVARGEAKG